MFLLFLYLAIKWKKNTRHYTHCTHLKISEKININILTIQRFNDWIIIQNEALIRRINNNFTMYYVAFYSTILLFVPFWIYHLLLAKSTRLKAFICFSCPSSLNETDRQIWNIISSCLTVYWTDFSNICRWCLFDT